MSEDPSTSSGFGRTRWAVAAAAVCCIPAGLVWIYQAALSRDFVGVVAGAGLCFGVLALDFMAAALRRMGGTLPEVDGRIGSLENRLTALEAAVGEADASVVRTVDLAAGTGNPESLVATHVQPDAFPRLVDRAPDGSDVATIVSRENAASAAASFDSQGELEELVRTDIQRLREDFAARVREHNHAEALRIGDRIVALFPESDTARQFKAIRVHLLRRAANDSTARPASAL